MRASTTRRIGSVAALGVGSLIGVGASAYGVLRTEAELARRAIGVTETPVPDATGWYGRGRPGPAIKIALLGDSSAAGYGVAAVEETPGAILASAVSAGAGRRVHLRELCKVGAVSADLVLQVDRALPVEPDVAVILIGANDVTHVVRPSESVRHLSAAVRRLREAGIAVVVGTCPDLGMVRPIRQPLRSLASSWSRRIAAAQAITVVEAGGRTVSLGTLLGPSFAESPGIYFGPDRFHPSARGYASVAEVLAPSVLSALGFGPAEEEQPEQLRGEGVVSLREAAREASRTPGTELDGAEVGGAKRGTGGRWVRLMRRRRSSVDGVEAPHHDEEPAPDDAVAGPESGPVSGG